MSEGFTVSREGEHVVITFSSKLRCKLTPRAAKLLAARLLVASEDDLESMAQAARGTVEDTIELATALDQFAKRFLPSGQ